VERASERPRATGSNDVPETRTEAIRGGGMRTKTIDR
jgi:hypothetical protein